MEETALQQMIAIEASAIALTVTLILPRAVWNPQKGVFHGYLCFHAIAVMALLCLMFGTTSFLQGESGSEILASIAFHLILGVIGSRIMVEYAHKTMFDEWLHKQGVWLLKKPAKTE